MTNAPIPREFRGRGLVPGLARGPALVSWDAISFLGDVDIRSGRIVGDLPSVKGACVAGTILIMPTSRGSAGAWRFRAAATQEPLRSAAETKLDTAWE